MNLRKATLDDLELLRHWDTQAHVQACNPHADWQWQQILTREVEWCQQFISELNGRPIGFLQIMDPYRDEEHYWGPVSNDLRAIDIWIGEATDLGKAYGTQMMSLAIDHCFVDSSVQAIVLDPLTTNYKAHRFYERLGFHCIQRRQFGADDCYVYRLDRADWLKPVRRSQQM